VREGFEGNSSFLSRSYSTAIKKNPQRGPDGHVTIDLLALLTGPTASSTGSSPGTSNAAPSAATASWIAEAGEYISRLSPDGKSIVKGHVASAKESLRKGDRSGASVAIEKAGKTAKREGLSELSEMLAGLSAGILDGEKTRKELLTKLEEIEMALKRAEKP